MESSGRNRLWFLAAWALVLGTVVLVLALFWQFIDVYFTLGDTPQVTEADGNRWVWTASACVITAGAAVIAALRARSRGMRWSSGVVLVVAVVASVVFIVPRDRWNPPPEPHEPSANYTPCYSGSNTCN